MPAWLIDPLKTSVMGPQQVTQLLGGKCISAGSKVTEIRLLAEPDDLPSSPRRLENGKDMVLACPP